jgi:hypothetical protein
MSNQQRYIIRTDRAGVFYAQIAERRDSEADLVNARRIHRWEGATECIGIALHGVGPGSRITQAIPTMTVLGVIEVLPCTDEAVAKLDAIPAWVAE